MKIQSFDGLSLHYECYGDKAATPLLLVHGIGADHDMWLPQITSLPGQGFYCIVPDLRGHGQSQVPAKFLIKDCARDLHDLLNTLKIEKAHLVGVSMGGMVVQEFVLQYPEQAASQTLVDSLSGIARPIERFNAWLAAIILQFLSPKTQAKMISDAYKKLGNSEVGPYFEKRLLSMDGKWLLEARKEVNRFNVLDKLAGMHCPTLVLVGDGFGKMAIEMARTSANGIPGAQFSILPGGGDPSNLLVPEAFDQMVIEFVHQMA